jgi:uncharacterized protein (TIGR02231 family)
MNFHKLLCLSSLFLFAVPASAQHEILELESKIDRVTVYPGFALVERLIIVPAQQVGSDFTVAVGPLPDSSQPSSFQTRVTGQALAVQGLELTSRLSAALNSTKTDELSIKLAELQSQLLVLQAKESGIKLQIQALQNMADYENQSTAATWGLPDGASDRLDFLRQQMTTFNADLQRNAFAIVSIEAQIKDINLQINGVRRKSKRRVREVRLNCFAQVSAPAQIRLSYLVSGASWLPSYDVHISPDMTGVIVKSMGQVTQHSGEDWSGVDLVLSTSMPKIGLDPPELPSLVVSIPQALRYGRRGRPEAESEDSLGLGGGAGGLLLQDSEVPSSPSAPSRKAAPTVQAVDYGITTQFLMPGKNDVASNGEPHRFASRTIPLEVEPERYIVPSQSDNAYLRAEVKHTGDSVLLAGTAKIFLGPDYLGESSFPLMRQEDSTSLNLGIDHNLVVVFETLEDYRDNPGSFSLSSTSTISRRYRASLRLAPSATGTIDVVVEESLPLSNSDSVTVSVADISPQTVNDDEAVAKQKERGVYRWEFRLHPGESKAVNWGYELSFDEDLYPTVSETL